MPIYSTYPNKCLCENAGAGYFKECLPTFTNCTPTCTDYYLKPCDELWCKTRCDKDCDYDNPFIVGDKIAFQLTEMDEFNPDPTMPTSGWGGFMLVELCDGDGNAISTDPDDFSTEYLVGWNGEYSYQTIVVDTSLLTVDCFSLKITSRKNGGIVQNEFCSEPFKKVDDICPMPTVLIESDYPCKDCCGYYYGVTQDGAFAGTGNFAYSNSFRVYGVIEQTGVDVTKEDFGSKFTGSSVACLYALKLTKKVPPYVMNQIYKQHFASETLYLDGEQFVLGDSSVSNKLSTGGMFLFEQEIYKSCDIKFGCC